MLFFRYLLLVASTYVTFALYIIPVGVFYHGNRPEIEDALNLAVAKFNNNSFYLRIHLNTTFMTQSQESDQRFISARACALAQSGVLALVSTGDIKLQNFLEVFAETFEIPLLHWSRYAQISDPTLRRFQINVRPQLHETVADFIVNRNWYTVKYYYDVRTGANNVLTIAKRLVEKYSRIVKFHVQLINSSQLPSVFDLSAAEYLNFDTDSHVILDFSILENKAKALAILANTDQHAKNIHYLLPNFDIPSYYVAKFKTGFTNITWFKLVNGKRRAEILNEWQKLSPRSDITPESAFAYDTISVLASTVLRMAKRPGFLKSFQDSRALQMNSLCRCYDKDVPLNQYGAKMVEFLKKTSFNGISGGIQFDSNGSRSNYSLELSDISFVAHIGPISVRSSSTYEWHQAKGFMSNHSKVAYFRHTGRETRANRTRIITTVLSAPFVMQTIRNNETYLEGYCIDLIEKLFSKIDSLPYEIILVKDGKYGTKNKDSEWDGMIGEIIRGDADVAVAPLTITTARQRVVAFSKPFMSLGITIMIRKPDKPLFSVFSMLSPFSVELWMYIIFAYMGISLVLFCVTQFTPKDWRIDDRNSSNPIVISNDFTIFNCLWFNLAAFMHQGSDILSRSVAGRIASSAWWIFISIVVSSYTANLAAFLTLEKMQTPIVSVEDLAKQTKIKYGIQGAGSTAEFFKDSEVQVYERMWQFMNAQTPSVFVKTYDEGIKRVRESKGRYAFLLESTANNYQNTRLPCNTMRVGPQLNSVGYGVATSFDSELRDKINLAILDLQQNGQLKKLENKWWFDKGQCGAASQGPTNTSLTMRKVAGLFYILIGGMITALLGAFVEFLYRSRLEARKHKRSFCATVKRMFVLAVSGTHADFTGFAQKSRKNSLAATYLQRVEDVRPYHIRSLETLDSTSDL